MGGPRHGLGVFVMRQQKPHCFPKATDLKMLVWNVRGLSNPTHRNVIRLFVQSLNDACVCLQESQLVVVDQSVITLGRGGGV